MERMAENGATTDLKNEVDGAVRILEELEEDLCGVASLHMNGAVILSDSGEWAHISAGRVPPHKKEA
jgi:hypothetical protein